MIRIERGGEGLFVIAPLTLSFFLRRPLLAETTQFYWILLKPDLYLFTERAREKERMRERERERERERDREGEKKRER